jgi:VanZ family protein
MITTLALFSLISVPPIDKVAHMGVSYAMTHTCQVLLKKTTDVSKTTSTIVCAATTLAIGGLKEIVDPYNGGTRDVADFAADAVGVGLAVTVISIDW